MNGYYTILKIYIYIYVYRVTTFNHYLDHIHHTVDREAKSCTS